METSFFKQIFTKPPILFPLVALFHLLMLGYSIYNYSDFPFPSIYWLPVIWLLLFSVSWIFICYLKRWAAWLYLAFTAINIILHYVLKYQSEVAVYTAPFLLLYVLFCFFVLVYYKKFI